MGCCGKNEFQVHCESMTWKNFKEETLEKASKRKNPGFLKYVGGVSDRAWEHVFNENYFTPKKCEEKLWSFFQSDILGK